MVIRYGHVLRRDDGYVLRKALESEVKGKRKRGRPKACQLCAFPHTEVKCFKLKLI